MRSRLCILVFVCIAFFRLFIIGLARLPTEDPDLEGCLAAFCEDLI